MIKINPVSKNIQQGQEIGRMKGPVKGRNWFSSDNPTYYIQQTGGSGIVTLQGTNSVMLINDLRDVTVYSPDLLPQPGTWTIIAQGSDTMSGSFSTEYQFLQLIVSTPGTGYVQEAWVYFN